MEIERKYLIHNIPFSLNDYPCKIIEQGYLCTNPVVRVRRSNDNYILTYKGCGMMVREEYNLPLTKEGYEHLIQKADGIIIAKRRYLIPYNDRLTIELDIFEGNLAPLQLAEVEFETKEEADTFVPPAWFGEDVTFSTDYHNSTLSALVCRAAKDTVICQLSSTAISLSRSDTWSLHSALAADNVHLNSPLELQHPISQRNH